MTDSHKKLPKLFWIQIALVLIVGTLYLMAPSPKKEHTASQGEQSAVKSASNNLKPLGNVAIKETKKESTVTAKGRSGKTIYNNVCSTCHKTGIANAPKIDDKAAWEPRVANGIAALVKTASSGKGAMPPRGGDQSLSDEELKNAILYMTHKAGFDLSSTDQTPANNGQNTQKASNKETNNSKKTAPQKTAEIAVVTPPPTPQAITAPSAPKPPEAPAEPASLTARQTMPEKTADEINSSDLKKGETVYRQTCFSCHDTGVANAPKITDKANWAPRLATGIEALYHSALNGKGIMPAKGGNSSLSDEDVKAAVDFMAATAGK